MAALSQKHYRSLAHVGDSFELLGVSDTLTSTCHAHTRGAGAPSVTPCCLASGAPTPLAVLGAFGACAGVRLSGERVLGERRTEDTPRCTGVGGLHTPWISSGGNRQRRYIGRLKHETALSLDRRW